MNRAKKDNVRSLTKEKSTSLSEQNRWPLAYAEGYISGQSERWRGNPPSSYIVAGIDQYALGFRAGYFVRPNPDRGSVHLGRTPSTAKNVHNDSAGAALV